MSFKINPNHGSLQKSYQKHQTNVLLSHDIPKDEATFMHDGKITCLVCNAWPVLDNINILLIHRNGRKHKEKYETFKQRKLDDLQSIEKRLNEKEKKGNCTKLLHQKRQEILSSGRFYPHNRLQSKSKHPKVKVQLQTYATAVSNLPSNSHITNHTEVESNRTLCLEQVQKTLQHMKKSNS